MRRGVRFYGIGAGVLCALFALLTAALLTVDVRPVGPQGSMVGLATVNQFFRARIGENVGWYDRTGWLGAIPLAVACGFAGAGAAQLIRRRSIRRVDRGIVALGAVYLTAAACYALFEVFVVNVRPVMVDGRLEASYPSSHTMLALVVMGTSMMYCHARLKNRAWLIAADVGSGLVVAAIFMGRLLSGVHWFTDVLGGLMLGCALAMAYGALAHGASGPPKGP